MRSLIIALCVSFILPVYSQKKLVTLNWKLDESNPAFESAVYIDSHNRIPTYSERISWEYHNLIPKVELTVLRTIEVTDSAMPLPNRLSETPEMQTRLVFEKKQPFLQVTITPFLKDSQSGKIQLLKDFELNIRPEKPISNLKALQKGKFSQNSVLAQNNWYKISVQSTGMHKLTYENLVEIGVENPATAKIFGAGAVQLPEDYSQGYYDDLSEIPVYMEKGADQLFGPGDYLLFYATGPVKWKYNPEEDFYTQHLHSYSTVGYYFITSGQGPAMNPGSSIISSSEPDKIITSYDALDYFEEETYNLLKSGKEWYGDHYSLTLSGAYPFTLKGLLTSDTLKVKVSGAIRSNKESFLEVKANSQLLGSFSANPVNLSNYASTFAIENSGVYKYKPSNETVTIQVSYLQPNANSEAWLNYVTINGRASLRMSGDELLFRDSRSASFGTVSEFRLGNMTTRHRVWDVTNPKVPINVPFSIQGNTALFKVPTDNLRTFVAFDPNGDFPVPIYTGPGTGKVANQNLHGTAPPDMLIIYPEIFFEQADRLAQHRKEHDGLDILMVTEEMIFNEFSSGTPDVSAIRNYLKMYYDHFEPDQMVDYLLLFGDGSFDNRDTGIYNPNLIMTYQSENSLVPTASFVSDDYFGLLDTGEKLYDGMLDLGIGRLPVSTVEEAEALVDKIIEYDQDESIGEWRNYICLIGDDEDGNIHMRQANSLANYIEETYPGYNVNRIFMDAYPQETTPTGDRYPEVTRAINDQMNRGALIINYTGHGGVTGLAHEKIVEVNTIKSWSNKGRYPLFMTATCEFSRYDEYSVSQKSEITSAGEEVLLNTSGGSIALFTTTRLVYSGPNHVLNEKFYEIVFSKKENGDYYRLGDIIAYSKNNAGAGINKRNFTLLGDPSMTLAFPRNNVITDSINNNAVELSTDTISALELVTISGHVTDQSGNLMQDFDGIVVPVVYDKKTNLKTLTNDGGNPLEFQTRNSILYKGNVSATKGRFKFSFYVPKDISYQVGEGKISYYSYNENTDAHGSENNILIGGLAENIETDTTGPEITIFMNDTLFRDGGIVTNSPELLVFIKDQFGINTTGNGIGHDITATLNGDRLNSIILNEYYLADINSYSAGMVSYPYNDLPKGRHTIDVKVWDIFNNSAQESIDFVVVESAEMLLEEIYNFPNPFTETTWFNIEHNRPDQELFVEIRVYSLAGELVFIYKNSLYSGGYRIDPPSWSGNSSGGATLSGGIYVYKVYIRSETGEEATGSGKLIIER